MTTFAYTYKDATGTSQTVNVTVTQTPCRPVIPEPDPISSGFEDLQESTITIALSQPVVVDLFLHFERTDVTTVGSQDTTIVSNSTIKVPRGLDTLNFTYQCKTENFGSPSVLQTRSYVFLEQPADTTGEKEDEEDPPKDPVEQSYNASPSYIFEFFKKTGEINTPCRVELYTKGFSANIKELSYMQARPLSIKTVSDLEQLYKPVIGTACTINLLAFQENEFRDLFTNFDGQVKLNYYEDNVLRFEGYNVAEYYRTNDSQRIRFVEVTFTDGIALLKNKPFKWATDTPRQKQLDIIWHILKGIGSTKPLMDKVYIYPADINYDIRQSPLTYVEADIRTYKDDDDKPMSCYKVLQSILEPYGAQIFSAWNREKRDCWHVAELNARGDGKLNWRYYENGSTVSLRGVNDVNTTLGIIINRSLNKRIKKMFHGAVIEKNLERIPTLIPSLRNAANIDLLSGWAFTGGNEYAEMIFLRDVQGSHLQLLAKEYTYNITNITESTNFSIVRPEPDNSAFAESESIQVFAESGNTIALTINAGTYVSQTDKNTFEASTYKVDSYLPVQVIIETPLNTFYLSYTEGSTEAVFQTTETHILLKSKALQVKPNLNTFAYVIPEAVIPADGEFKFRIHAPSQALFWNGAFLLSVATRWFVGDIEQEYQTTLGFAKIKETIFADAAVKRSNEVYKTQIIHTDANTLQNVSALTHSGGTLTSTWIKHRSYRTPQARPIAQLLAESIIENQYSNSTWVYEDIEILESRPGLGSSAHSFAKAIGFLEYPGRRWLAVDYEYTPKHESYVGHGAYIRVTYAEVNDAQPLINYVTETDDTKRSRSTTNGGGSGPAKTTVIENPFDIATVASFKEVPEAISVHTNPVTGQLVIDNEDIAASAPDLEAVMTQGAITSKIPTFSALGVGSPGMAMFSSNGTLQWQAFDNLERVCARGAIAFDPVTINNILKTRFSTTNATGRQTVFQAVAKVVGTSTQVDFASQILLGVDRGDGVEHGALLFSQIKNLGVTNQHNFGITVRDDETLTDALVIDPAGSVTLADLAGTGDRLAKVNSAGTLGSWGLGSLLEVNGNNLAIRGTRTANYIPIVNDTNDALVDSAISSISLLDIGSGTTIDHPIIETGLLALRAQGSTEQDSGAEISAYFPGVPFPTSRLRFEKDNLFVTGNTFQHLLPGTTTGERGPKYRILGRRDVSIQGAVMTTAVDIEIDGVVYELLGRLKS